MSIAEKEHVWRIGKKWDNEGELEHVDESISDQEEMVPKKLYDNLLKSFRKLEKQHKLQLELMVQRSLYEELMM